MFNRSLMAHPTSSYPFKKSPLYRPIPLPPYPSGIRPRLFCPTCSQLCSPLMETTYSEEEFDLFYMEIEERLMRVISDEEDEEPPIERNRAPLLPVSGNNPQFFANSDSSFRDVNCYGPLDPRMNQLKRCFGSGNWEKSPWEMYETRNIERGMRLPSANERRGTGVFIPRSA